MPTVYCVHVSKLTCKTTFVLKEFTGHDDSYEHGLVDLQFSLFEIPE